MNHTTSLNKSEESLKDRVLNKKKVDKIHGLDKEMLEELSSLNDYWSSAHDFIISIKDRPLENLTRSQLKWFEKIKNSYESQHEKNFL